MDLIGLPGPRWAISILPGRESPASPAFRLGFFLLLLAGSAQADSSWDRYQDLSSPRQERGYSSSPPQNRQMSIMNARLSFLQTPRVAPAPAQRYETWKNQPLVQAAPARKPDTFLAYLGRSIKQNVVEVSKAIVAAVVRPIQAIKQIVTTVVRAFAPMVSQPPPPKGPQNINTPMPEIPKSPGFTPTPQEKPKPITTPINTQKPTPITTPIQTQRPHHNITLPAPAAPTVTMKGNGLIGALIDVVKETFIPPKHVPTNKLYPEPGGDSTRRGGLDDNAIHRRRNEIINGQMKPIKVIETQKGYMISDGEHRWEAARQMKMPTVPVRIIGREKNGPK